MIPLPTVKVDWEFWFDDELKHFVAKCNELNLTSEAPTINELLETIVKTQESFFIYLGVN